MSAPKLTPHGFVTGWHEAAGLALPRWIPDGWLRTAGLMMERGVDLVDLQIVALWMRTQQRRAMEREPGAVAFNAASFAFRKMFGDFGASDQGERFAELLASATASAQKPRKAAARPVQAASAVSPADWDRAAAEARKLREQFEEGAR